AVGTRARSASFVVVVVALVGALATAWPGRAGARPLGAAEPSVQRCPLTGLAAPASQVERPAVAVRVSNSPDALPQTGVAGADVVVETLVEGGLTRLVAVFHCSPVAIAGPVRSARSDDARTVAAYAGLLAFSGANEAVGWELARSATRLVSEATVGDHVYRDPAGSLDVNSVRADLSGLRDLATTLGLKEPFPRFRFGDVQSPSSPASFVSLYFGDTLVEYRWHSGFWRRSQDREPFLDAQGRQVTARNVLVQEVDAFASPALRDSIGTPSPVFDLVGPGRALLFRDGRVVIGTWSQPTPGDLVFRTQRGALMSLARGRTWVEMVPSGIGDLKGTISYR
ncbi:MAG TPA: DUF3048 domain-containing protein, partial [Actinomycetota bacterium]|nr:DUF3048 domain-containing protein [Actinomycetota bacterium]